MGFMVRASSLYQFCTALFNTTVTHTHTLPPFWEGTHISRQSACFHLEST